jgi:hypothetical protein
MEKENKYYTPSIDEFHVGFKYQELDSNDVWVDKVFYSLLLDFNINYVRVKYLDKEDIKSLGWIEKSEFDNDETKQSYWNPEKEVMLTMFNEDYKVRIAGGTNTPRFLFFHGTIKNKSELKKLIKQLNII